MGRSGAEDTIGRVAADSVIHHVSVNFVHDLLDPAGLDDAVTEEGRHSRPTLGSEVILQTATARRRRSGDEVVGWVARIHSLSEVLRRQEVEVTVDRENLSLGVKMVDGGGGVAAGDLAETFVLDELESVDGGGGVGWKDDWSRVVKEWTDESLESL